MTVVLNYSGTRYELAANVAAHEAFSLMEPDPVLRTRVVW